MNINGESWEVALRRQWRMIKTTWSFQTNPWAWGWTIDYYAATIWRRNYAEREAILFLKDSVKCMPGTDWLMISARELCICWGTEAGEFTDNGRGDDRFNRCLYIRCEVSQISEQEHVEDEKPSDVCLREYRRPDRNHCSQVVDFKWEKELTERSVSAQNYERKALEKEARLVVLGSGRRKVMKYRWRQPQTSLMISAGPFSSSSGRCPLNNDNLHAPLSPGCPAVVS